MVDEVKSVFADLGFDEIEAARFDIMSDLLTMIRDEITSHSWTQAQSADRLGWHQPRVSQLMTGKLHQFSLDSLFEAAKRLGLHVGLESAPREQEFDCRPVADDLPSLFASSMHFGGVESWQGVLTPYTEDVRNVRPRASTSTSTGSKFEDAPLAA